MGILKDVLHLFYPELCPACEMPLQEEEKLICLPCHIQLPKTQFHTYNDNPFEKIFWGRFPLAQGSSYYYFHKGSKVQTLLHHIKYKGVKEAAEVVGRWYGQELIQKESYKTIDYIVPVPLHPKKEKKRGYNQSLWFAKGLSAALEVPLDHTSLVRTYATDTQTKKGRFQRWQNVGEVFALSSEDNFRDKHVLLVDDVITTGATLEACAKTILNCGGNTKISMATIAFAS